MWLLIVASVLGVAFIGASFPLHRLEAQEVKSTRVGLVNMERVLGESTAMQAYASRLAESFQSLQTLTATRQQEINVELQNLQDQAPLLSQEAALQAESELNAKKQRYEEDIAALQEQIQRADINARTQVINQASDVLRSIAEARNFDMFIVAQARGNILLINPELDVTAQVVTEINQTLLSINEPLPVIPLQ